MWFGVLASCARHIAEPAFAARDTTLTIMTTSLEMLQIKPFSSKRYPSDLVRHLYIPETPAASFILLKLVDAILLFKRAHAHRVYSRGAWFNAINAR